MKLTQRQIEEGLDHARQTLAGMEEVDFDDLADDAGFREQYAKAALVLIKMMAVLYKAKLTEDQRAALDALIARHNRCASALTQDVLAHWSEQASERGALN
ncbi:hypothetical protein EEB18_021565 [Sphingopyxis sp. OPL5]|uniref:hypothetical protein n=1 Tax=Sphingopyxis sp. OPL5 TaxID=2486273 RepID=UPI00164EA6F6|nr:hypothetical protein [Sphingopyxis sp. OPL5]QNO27259.1 hypothetical protein EEB18_021565 [Sphingopyxis sp. OPL5]